MNISNDERKFCKVVKVLYTCNTDIQIESVRHWIHKLVFIDVIDFKSKLLVLCDQYETELYNN